MKQRYSDNFSFLFREHPLPTWIVAKQDFIAQDVNEAALTLLNLNRRQFLKTNIKSLFLSDWVKIQKALRRKAKRFFNLGILQHSNKNGTSLSLEVSFKEIVYNDQPCYIFIANEIKSDGKTSETLHDDHVSNASSVQEELSSVIINSLPGVFYLFDESGKFLRWNKNFETVTGYSSEEIEKMIPLDFFRGTDKEIIFDRISAVFTEGKAEAWACFHTKYDTQIPYHFNGNLIEYKGKPCLIGMGIDVTQEKAIEKEREELLTRFEKLSDNIPGFIYEYCLRTDGSSYFPFTSKGIKDIYGLTPEDVKKDSSPLFSRIHPDDVKIVKGGVGLSTTSSVNSTEFRVNSNTGKTTWVKTNAAAEPQPDGSLMYYGYTEDITSVKEAEYELIKTNRLISFTSHIHEMVIHAKSQEEYLREACRIAVVHGGFRMAWIGKIDLETNTVVPETWYGHVNDFFRVVKSFSLQDSVDGYGPSCTAAIHGMTFINNDISDIRQNRYETWAHEAVIRRYRSCIEMPMKVKDETIGIFNLYHEDSFFFTEKEIKTLEEMMAEIGFGLNSLRIAEDRQKKIIEQYTTQKQLDQKRKMIEAVSEIQAKFIEERTPAAYFNFALERILALTGSEYGFIGEVVYDTGHAPSLKCHATNSFDDDTSLFTLFENVVKRQEKVISNDPSNNLKGSVSPRNDSDLRCLLGLPIISGEDLVGMIGLANRVGGYTIDLADELNPIVYTIRGILQAYRTEAMAKQVGENLKNTLTHLELAHQASGLGVWKLNFRQKTLLGDDRCVEAFGIGKSELTLDEYRNLVHPDDREAKVARDKMLLDSTATDYFSEYRIIRPRDGLVRYIKSQGLFFRDERGVAISGVSVIYDQTKEKQFEKSLLNSVQEKEMLIKEIHHRVKNNLQLISSMLYLKTLAWNNSEANEFMKAMREKIKSVSLIHERLLQTENLNSIDIQEYLQKLLHDIEVTYHRHDLQLIINSNIESLYFTSDHATSLGQLVNELVINAIKHGFANKQRGEIMLSLQKTDAFYELTVEDDGNGFPTEIDPLTSVTYGMQLIQIFVKQLNGTFEVVPQPTRFQIKFLPESFAK